MNFKNMKAGFDLWIAIKRHRMTMIRCEIQGHIPENIYYKEWRNDEYLGEKFYLQCKRCSQILVSINWNGDE